MRLKFPDQVVTTLSRSDMVLSSLSSRQEILPELTAPWENQVEKANERKRSKYHELVHCEPTEMECRGFALTVSTVYWEYWVTKRKAVSGSLETLDDLRNIADDVSQDFSNQVLNQKQQQHSKNKQ